MRFPGLKDCFGDESVKEFLCVDIPRGVEKKITEKNSQQKKKR